MYVESNLLPWFNVLRFVKAAISSDLGLVQSSRLSNIALRWSLWSSSSVLKYVLASFPAHRVTNLIFVFAFLICESTMSIRSSTSSLQSLNHWCKPASSVQSILGPWTYCIFWYATCISVLFKFGSLYFWHHVSFSRKDELLQMFCIVNLYSCLVSSTTCIHAICMRPRLLLKLSTKDIDPGKLFG